jgi:Fe-S oxidoreductase
MMSLEQYRDDMTTCCRCSCCKTVTLETLKNAQYLNGCPSIARYGYRAYSGGGRLALGVGLLDGNLDYNSKKLAEITYNCQVCGLCDTACKYAMDMEVLDPIVEIRSELVKHGNTNPVLDKMIGSLKKSGPMVVEATGKRGEWLSSLDVKDYTKASTEVVYHAGCRTCYDKSLWPVAQKAVKMMKKAGIDVGVAFEEHCCGGRAYQMGYQEEALAQAKRNMEVLKKAGVKTLVTGCAECYWAFGILYDKLGVKGDLEVMHTSQYFAKLIKAGKIKPRKAVEMTVTYHDPCHLGRQGEPYIKWEGKRKAGQIILFEPEKTFRRGYNGIYDAPREVLKSVPGLKLIEMDRHMENAWCCGAGGGVKETNPEYAAWTATERINEAVSTTASAIVSGCPGCENLFSTTIKKNGEKMKVYDLVEILAESVL